MWTIQRTISKLERNKILIYNSLEDFFYHGAAAPKYAKTSFLSRIHYYVQLDTPHWVGLPWRSDQPFAENSDNTQHTQENDIHSPPGFEATIPATEPLQTHVLDRSATGIGIRELHTYTGSSKKMDGILNRYNLKSTRRIYTFGVLKCSEKFNVLDLPQYISICAPFVALETSKRNYIPCHVF